MSESLELTNYFLDSVKKHFNFLLDYNFSIKDQEIMGSRYAAIIYENEKLVLACSFNSYSYEIELTLTNKLLNLDVSLNELIKIYDVDKELGFIAPQASTLDLINKVLLKISSFIKKRQKVLSGDVDEFEEIRNFKKKVKENNLAKLKFQAIEDEVNLAWESQQYEKVISLYESIDIPLDKIARKRLEYAKKKIKSK